MYTLTNKENRTIYRDAVENVEVSIPKGDSLGIIKIEEPPLLEYPRDYEAAIKNPIDTDRLNIIGKGKKKVAIIVSDATRGVPTATVIPFVVQELKDAGITEDQITVVVALGVHRPATTEEMIEMVGEKYFRVLNVVNHEPFNRDELVFLGNTSHGTPIEVNKTVYDSDLRIAIGKVEPHEFAGFSGGRKSVLPGICSERTVEVNHHPDMILRKNVGPGMVKHNIISKDMSEGANMFGLDFIVNFVVNAEGKSIGIFSGDLNKAHEKAIDFMRSFCEVNIQEKPDIVVTTPGEPLNIDFYQSIKPIISLENILSADGVIVLYTLCEDGINSDDMLAAYQGAENMDEVVQYLQENYKIQMDHALLLCKVMKKGIRIVVHSPNIDDKDFETMLLKTANNPQEALEKAYVLSGKSNPNVLFFPQPQRTLLA